MPESSRGKIQRTVLHLVLYFSYASMVLNVCLKEGFFNLTACTVVI